MTVISDTQLTDLPSLKSWLNISSTDTAQDTHLARLIIAVSATFKQLVNRPKYITGTYTDSQRGNGSNMLFLPVQPVTSIISLYEDSALMNSSSLSPYQYTGYSFSKYGIVLPYRSGTSNTYTITYVGGFAINSDEAYMAEQAVLSLCNLWWKRRPHADELARSLGNQITAKFTEEELPPETKAIVRTLKRVA